MHVLIYEGFLPMQNNTYITTAMNADRCSFFAEYLIILKLLAVSASNPPSGALYTVTRNNIFNKGNTKKYFRNLPYCCLCVYCSMTSVMRIKIHSVFFWHQSLDAIKCKTYSDFINLKMWRKCISESTKYGISFFSSVRIGELHNLHSSPDIIRQIKSRRMRWAGHVARMGEGRNV
jgi:hypothetical protein